MKILQQSHWVAAALAVIGVAGSVMATRERNKQLVREAKAEAADAEAQAVDEEIATRRDVRDNRVERVRHMSRMRAVLAAQGGGALSNSSVLLREANKEFILREKRLREDAARTQAGLLDRAGNIRRDARQGVKSNIKTGIAGAAAGAAGAYAGYGQTTTAAPSSTSSTGGTSSG